MRTVGLGWSGTFSSLSIAVQTQMSVRAKTMAASTGASTLWAPTTATAMMATRSRITEWTVWVGCQCMRGQDSLVLMQV